MDQLSTWQNQISNQLAAINATLSKGGISGSIQTALSTSAASLQGLLNKLTGGSGLSPADQQLLQDNLSSSKSAILAAQAHRDGLILVLLIGAGVVGLAIFLVAKHRQGLKHRT